MRATGAPGSERARTRRSAPPWLRRAWIAAAIAAVAGCGGAGPGPSGPDPGGDDEPIAVPAYGTTETLDVATWNVEFFGSPDGGPADDDLQRRRVRDVVSGTDADLWGVQEISDGSDFERLLLELPGYAGLLADDPSVTDGAAFYSDFGGTELKVGLIYKTDIVQVTDARLILTDLDFEFAGRPPLELRLRVTSGGEAREITVVVLHAKAGADDASRSRREDGAVGLAAYLDATWPDAPVLVLGDFNDDVDTSIASGRDTPYRVFLDAPERWTFPTAELSDRGETSILGFADMIDHVLASDETAAWYEAGSATVHRVDAVVPDYADSTSDHLPVLVRLRPGA